MRQNPAPETMSETTENGNDIFPRTRWSRVIAAQREDTRAVPALNELCQAYWQPVYGFIRRKVFDVDEAQDLTQDYFASLIRRDYIKKASEGIGRLRAFLLADIKLFLNNARRNRGAVKRGGGAVIVPLDVDWAERHFEASLHSSLNDDAAFDREWALRTIEQGRQKLADEYSSPERRAVFTALCPWIDKSPTLADYEALCRTAGLTSPDAAKVALSRLRSRLGDALRNVVGDTLADSRDVDEELRHLFDVLAGIHRGEERALD